MFWNRRILQWIKWGGAIVPPLLVITIFVAHYYPFFADDAFISLRYSQRLIDGHGLTWTEGERVEGYSNLLWVLATAFLDLLGLDPVGAARALGVFSALSFIGALAFMYRPTGPSGPWPVLVGGLAVAVCRPVAVWAIGGLEQVLYSALLVWALILLWYARSLERLPMAPSRSTERAVTLSGACFALLCLTRPDGPLFVVAAVVILFFCDGGGLAAFFRRRFRLVLLPIAAVCLQVGFRLIYYRDWVPNTARIKARWSRELFENGIEYLQGALSCHWPLVSLALLAFLITLVTRRHLDRGVMVMVGGIFWALYIISVGGDIFPAYRHAVPLVILHGLLIATGVDAFLSKGTILRALAVCAVASGALLWLHDLHGDDEQNRRAEVERWEWDGEVVGRLFREGFEEERPLWAVTAAGSMPYFSGLPALDMLGLNDRHIARQPPNLNYKLGHQHGDGRYVLERRPDIITFGIPAGREPCFVPGRHMRSDPRFLKGYRRVFFEGFMPHFVRNRSFLFINGKLGLRRTSRAVEVPPYMLRGHITGVLGPSGGIAARLEADQLARSPTIELPPGCWTLDVRPSSRHLTVSLANRGQQTIEVSAGDSRVLYAQHGAQLEVLCKAVGMQSLVELIGFRKVGDEVCAVAQLEPLGSEKVALVTSLQTVIESTANLTWSFDGKYEEEGWTSSPSGDVLNQWLARGVQGKQGEVSGHHGGLLNSYHPRTGDSTTGVARGPRFVVPAGGWISLRVGGGTQGVGVRLRDETRIYHTWVGRTSEQLMLYSFDLSSFEGKELLIEVVDEARGGWGHILVDEIEVHRPVL